MTHNAEKKADRAGSVPVYAFAAGIASALPIPFFDTAVAEVARGGAMRRIAKRHGIVLTSEARKTLATAGVSRDRKVPGLKYVRSVAQRFFLPLMAYNRVEGSLAAIAAALLFEHYVISHSLPHDYTVDGSEARRIAKAIDDSLLSGAGDALKTIPGNLLDLGHALVAAARALDDEGRARHEAVLDTVLDTVADVPEDVLDALRARFDRALAQ